MAAASAAQISRAPLRGGPGGIPDNRAPPTDENHADAGSRKRRGRGNHPAAGGATGCWARRPRPPGPRGLLRGRCLTPPTTGQEEEGSPGFGGASGGGGAGTRPPSVAEGTAAGGDHHLGRLAVEPMALLEVGAKKKMHPRRRRRPCGRAQRRRSLVVQVEQQQRGKRDRRVQAVAMAATSSAPGLPRGPPQHSRLDWTHR